MSAKDNPQNVIDAYKKRQRMTPFLIGGTAILLVVVGIILLVISLTKPGGPAFALFASATPTATNTVTPTATVPTPTPTETATVTVTPTETLVPTQSGPIEYTVKENDNCFDLSVKYDVDLMVLLAINEFPAGQCPIKVGDKILIPAPDQALPTMTAIPTGTKLKVEYIVQTGDTLAIIASRFNSTIQAIIDETNRTLKLDPKLTDPNKIQIGMKLIVPANIVTPTATLRATNTSAATQAPAATATITPQP